MSFDNLTRRVQFDGDGLATSFPFTFPFQLKSDIVVTLVDVGGIRAVLVLDLDYELSGDGDPNGGEVVLGTELLVGEILVIERTVELKQDTDIDNLGESYPEVTEAALDKQMQASQQLEATKHSPVEYDVLPPAVLANRNRIISLRTSPAGASVLKVCQEQGPGVFEWKDLGGGTSSGGDIASDSLWVAKGDLAVGLGVGLADRLPVGSSGQFLTVDLAQTLGLKWVAGTIQSGSDGNLIIAVQVFT